MFDRGLAQTSPSAHLQNPASGNMAPHHLQCFPPQLVDDSVCQQHPLLQSHGFVLVLQQDQGTQGQRTEVKKIVVCHLWFICNLESATPSISPWQFRSKGCDFKDFENA